MQDVSPRTRMKQRRSTNATVSLIGFLAAVAVIAALLSACGPTITPESTACVRDGSTYVCGGLDDHQIEIMDVPGDVTVDLLEISQERRQELLDAPTEGTGCVFMIAADIVFYKDGELLTKFDSPITISYYVLQQDLETYTKCQEMLKENGTVESAEQVEFVPIYFDKEKWMPFAEETIVVVNQESGEMTIKVTSWGDQPIGSGTRP